MKQVQNIFKTNTTDQTSKTDYWRRMGMTYYEFRHSTFNPRRGSMILAGDAREGFKEDKNVK